MTDRNDNAVARTTRRDSREARRPGSWPRALLLAACVCVALLSPGLAAERSEREEAEAEDLPTVAEKTAGLERRPGLLTMHLDPQRGKVWLELPPAGRGASLGAAGPDEVGRFLYVEGLASGVGSNPLFLDRGQLGETRLVVLRRVGGRLLVEQPNLAFRALSGREPEARAVEQSFATSVLWAGEIAALEPDGRALVDWTSFLVRDAHGVAARLAAAGQGEFALDAERSAVDLTACLGFPDNLELEAVLTYAGRKPGEHVRSVTPTPDSVTVVQHHSLLRLPDDGYRPRPFDPRAGSFAIEFLDYAAPLDEPIVRRWIVRHRLRRDAAPLVYHVDRGVPEPVRSALVDGAAWWAEAFAAAGFPDVFRVELLPADAHPLDARYNVIQWVHRSTRGWSYGGGVVDPRTGEMVKGHVSLGSLRVRQDRLLFEGLLGTSRTGSGEADDPLELALARIRQLAAHEVGHTLGLTHNFAASTYADRASVMDYPAPRIRIGEDGRFDCRDAYGVGVGAWDVHAIRYAYTELGEGKAERLGLEAIVRDGLRAGLRFLSDRDARPAGAAHPLANLWDNGSDPVAELAHTLRVRRRALERFGVENVRPGTPLALLEEVLAPVYFHHRYQLTAAVKTLGGLDYAYAVRGDGQDIARPVAGARQRAALAAVLEVLTPEELDLPDDLIAALLPRPFGIDDNRERFPSRTSPAFDPLAAASAAAGAVVDGVLQPERCGRLVDFHRRDPALPGLEEVLATLVGHAFDGPPPARSRHAELRRAIQRVLVERMLRLADDETANGAVRSRVEGALDALAERLAAERRVEDAERAHRRYLRRAILRHLDRRHPSREPASEAPAPPPGAPIGASLPMPDAWGGCTFGDR